MDLNLFVTPDQREIVTARERFLCLIAGRRWGKTATVRSRIIQRCSEEAGFRYIYICPFYAQSVEEYDKFIEHRAVRKLISHQRRQPFPQLRLINGAKVQFRSFEKPKSIRSGGFKEVWIDEIQDINEKQFWPIIRPLISDLRGTLGLSGQFRGHNWFYKQFYLNGIDPKKTMYKAWRKPSNTGLMYQSVAGREEIELARTQMPRVVYDQEYDCIPSANQNAVFDPNDVTKIVQKFPSYGKPIPGIDYILALDIGRVVDPCVFIIGEAKSGRIIYAHEFELRTKHEIMARQVAKVAKRFSAAVIADTTGGATGGHADHDKYLKFYRKEMPRMHSFMFNQRTKEGLITELSLAIQNGTISISNELYQVETQLREYEYHYRGGHYQYNAPDGKHDDFVAATGMFVYAMGRQWFGRGYSALNTAL